MSEHRCGTVGIVGRPNTGKSSLFNRLVGEKLSSVSPRAQTTRHSITGILTAPDCQYIFTDAPGLQRRSRNALGATLNRRAGEAPQRADAALLVVEALRWGPEDAAALALVPKRCKTVAVVNKIDRVKRKTDLLPFLEKLSATGRFEAIVPVSARTGENLPELLRALRELLPRAPAMYPPDQLTDRDERFYAAELLREKLFRALGQELPYRCEVLIDSFREAGRLKRIAATILVERESQKGIVVGKGGAMLKKVASAARKDMERLFGGKVHLEVWVKVREGWADDTRVLLRLGHG